MTYQQRRRLLISQSRRSLSPSRSSKLLRRRLSSRGLRDLPRIGVKHLRSKWRRLKLLWKNPNKTVRQLLRREFKIRWKLITRKSWMRLQRRLTVHKKVVSNQLKTSHPPKAKLVWASTKRCFLETRLINKNEYIGDKFIIII